LGPCFDAAKIVWVAERLYKDNMMRKLLIFFGMITAIMLVCIFNNTNQLLLQPLTTPERFLSSMPYISLSLFQREYVLIQPSSTILVYSLGLFMFFIGIYFVITRKHQKSREYWGIGLILWGISAIVAGTSYQAFGYELKCNHLEFCLFTSNVELAYMLLTAYAINYLVVAIGYTSLAQAARKRLIQFAILDSILYFVYMLIGAIIPIKFIVSYEGFMSFIGVNFIIMFILNIRHYSKFKDALNRNLIMIWFGFLLVNIGYFVFLFGELGIRLYKSHGIWFNENDALHILLILWTLMLFLLLRTQLMDTAKD
jgi:hypothetical protein